MKKDFLLFKIHFKLLTGHFFIELPLNCKEVEKKEILKNSNGINLIKSDFKDKLDAYQKIKSGSISFEFDAILLENLVYDVPESFITWGIESKAKPDDTQPDKDLSRKTSKLKIIMLICIPIFCIISILIIGYIIYKKKCNIR
ncbi:hypothetical protein EHP00_2175 [Ecytonucleospora hepatopenaei]|uniref:Uncharacterized protein n=1 Tax=Ecytonucleospora hepatopenaei TaxID=646526 RepID=A0A1W0E5E5_9MICR|nr:hypothetical protein EHP00_2175 [Ecytonucleospora hepatopenaei]